MNHSPATVFRLRAEADEATLDEARGDMLIITNDLMKARVEVSQLRVALEQQVTQQAATIAELLILVKTGYEIIPYLTGLSDHAATMREEWKLKAIAALASTKEKV